MSTTKNPAAVELGSLGGKKGGKARNPRKGFGANPEKARAAALKRWGKRSSLDSETGSEPSRRTSPASSETAPSSR